MSIKKSPYLFFSFLMIFLIKLSKCDKNKSDERSLYENSTGIITATPANLRQLIYEKPFANLVFFYENWSEKSINQIEVNLQLEKEVIYWQKVLKFVTINYDAQVSSDFNITKLFEYKLAKPNTQRSNQLIQIDVNGPYTKESLIKSILLTLLKLNKTNQEFKENGWPKLNSLNLTDFKQIRSFTNKTLIFVNRDNSIEDNLVSLETILDFSNYTDDLEILNCNESVLVNSNHSKQHISYPALYQFDEQNRSFNLIQQGLNRTEFRNLIKNKFLFKKWISIDVNTKSRVKNITHSHKKEIINVFPVYFRDLNNALRKIIFSDFARFKVLSPEKVKIMTRLMNVFREYFLYDNENSRRFLRRISQWFKEQNQTEPMKVEKFKAIIKAGAEGFLPVEQPYISCKGSQAYLRGYPCSIWLLFHSLTVQEYLKLTNKNITIKKSNFTLAPHSVVYTMKDYIEHFFPCTSCVQSFQENTINFESELIYPNSSVLWLWQIHNKMNLMLKNKINDDPEWPKQIFPAYEACKKCYLKEPTGSFEKIYDLNRIEWNKTEVVEFLVNLYKKENMKSAAFLSNLNCLFLMIYPLLIRSLMNKAI